MTAERPEVRAQPQQRRALQTVAKIQDATRQIVLDAGLEALNTNAIAELAGVNVATIYNYYSDKYAILAGAFAEHEELRTEFLDAQFATLDESADIRAWINHVITGLAEIRGQDPYQVTLRQAMTAVPRLAELDRSSMDTITAALSAAIVRWRPKADPADVRSVARLVVTVATTSLDSAFESGAPDWEAVSELCRMLQLYVEDRLG